MAKQLFTSYAFTPGAANAGTVTVPGTYALNQFLLITNVTAGVVIYQFNAPAKGAALNVAGGSTTLTLEYSTATMSAGDSLQIFADSTTGSSANTVLSGSGAPASGTGSNGDFYIDTTNTRIYGPKASGAWGSGTTLVGPTGAAATVSVGTTTTGAAGTSASVTNTGTSSAATFNFTIPRGDTGATGAAGSTGATGATGAAGAAASVSVGSTTTGAAGTSASVTNTGTSSAVTFNFTIPRGDTGATGSAGASGVANATAPITYNSGTQTVGISAATTSAAGSMSSADKTKLDGVATGATANSSDATLLARGNHTGTQAGSTVTGAYTASGLTMSTVRLLGRTTASSGAAEEISVGTGLSLSGGTLTATATGSGSGTKTLQRFTPRENQPPSANFATLNTRNSIAVLEFDAATQESSTFVGVIPEGANLASGLLVRIWWMGATATSGNVRWGASFEATGTDLDADSFDTVTQATSTANGTSGIETLVEITCTAIDSLAAGNRFRLRVDRIAADATNDTMTGDAQLVAVEVRGVA